MCSMSTLAFLASSIFTHLVANLHFMKGQLEVPAKNVAGLADGLGFLSPQRSEPDPDSVFRFWQIWFDFDNVMLGPQRREYLEHRFETVSSQ